MKTVPLDAAGPAISRLGFGCAPVMGKVGRRQALDAMACAFELGVTHFDIARSYGFGDAEAVLGEFARGRRDRITIASKFGVVPPVLSGFQRAARPVVRPLLKRLAPFRKKVQQVSTGLLAERRFDLAYARQCLETSLRQLGTERLDIYLLHEPELDTLSGAPELRGFLDDSVAAGRIRAWGLAHPHGHSVAFEGVGRVLQFEAPASSVDGWMPARQDPRLLFVTRPFSGGMLEPDGRAVKLMTQLELDPLQLAMARASAAVGAQGAIVAGMFDRAHIAQNVAALAHCEARQGELNKALATVGIAVRG